MFWMTVSGTLLLVIWGQLNTLKFMSTGYACTIIRMMPLLVWMLSPWPWMGSTPAVVVVALAAFAPLLGVVIRLR